MRQHIITLFAFALLFAAHVHAEEAAEQPYNKANAESFCHEMQACGINNLANYDDGISSAQIIASAIISSCSIEAQQCVVSMQDNAVKKIPDRLKSDGTYDKMSPYDLAEIEKRVRSDESVASFRETIKNDMIIPMILRHRVSQKQD